MVDELIVHALEHEFIKKENEEIDSFLHVLSDMHSSLKLWIPRLEQAFGSSAVELGDQSELFSPNRSFSNVDGENSIIPNGSTEQGLGLIVSPSPLVSWRNGKCTVESGQLFLLTPLHKPKLQAFEESHKCLQVRSSNKYDSFSRLRLPTLSNAPRSNFHKPMEKADTKPTPNKFLVPETRASEGSSKDGFASGTKSSNNGNSLISCSSPFVKTSPLKACFLLDSVSDSIHRGHTITRNGTPWVPRTQKNSVSAVFYTASNDKDFGSDEISMTLASKYPELFGLPPAHESTFQRKEVVDETLDWFLSPPKTCVLMEPLDENVTLPSGGDEQTLNSENDNLKQAGPEITPMWKDLKSTTDHSKNAGEATLKRELWTKYETTPMWKDLESTSEHGKNAGEATLKRELWTKFEAVSVNGLQFDRSVFQQISRNKFLDMLEEVS